MTEMPPERAPLSGWCSPPDQRHDSACRVCEMRQRDGLLGPCGCRGHDAEKPVVERDSHHFQVESETKRGTDRANESVPLATVSTTPKGA